jgi:hypothetical protein
MTDRIRPRESTSSGFRAAALLLIIILGFCAAGSDAKAESPSLCGGESVPLHIDESGSPIARLGLDGRESDFLIDTGSTLSIIDAYTFRIFQNDQVTLKGFTLPTISEGSFRVWHWLAHGRSIIGTDILRMRTVEIHYGPSDPYLALSDGPCSAPTLETAGFARIDEQGYYGTEATHKKPTLPVVFVRIGKVTAPFYLDSGRADFADGGLLAVNEPYRNLLERDGVSMELYSTSHVSDCRGRASEADVVTTRSVNLAILSAEGGAELASYDVPKLMVMPEGSMCGKAEELARPFGLIGSSFLRKWGTVIIDPFSEAVWIKLG